MTDARGGNGAPGRGIPASARGAVLVGLAVIAGIVGLQILDDSGSTDVTASSPDSTTSPVVDGATSTTLGTARDPSEVRVKVYNASGVQGQAQAESDKLKALGWATVEPADYGSTRVGTSVQCRSGFEADATVLAVYGVGNGATVEAFPSSPPPGAGDADCLVILGKPA
jgi:hypothetical protein